MNENAMTIWQLEQAEYCTYNKDLIDYDNTCDVYRTSKDYAMDDHAVDYELVTNCK